MTDHDIARLTRLVEAMPQDQRLQLDPISEALQTYQEAHPPGRGYSLANRIAALAAVEAAEAWERAEWERD